MLCKLSRWHGIDLLCIYARAYEYQLNHALIFKHKFFSRAFKGTHSWRQFKGILSLHFSLVICHSFVLHIFLVFQKIYLYMFLFTAWFQSNASTSRLTWNPCQEWRNAATFMTTAMVDAIQTNLPVTETSDPVSIRFACARKSMGRAVHKSKVNLYSPCNHHGKPFLIAA